MCRMVQPVVHIKGILGTVIGGGVCVCVWLDAEHTAVSVSPLCWHMLPLSSPNYFFRPPDDGPVSMQRNCSVGGIVWDKQKTLRIGLSTGRHKRDTLKINKQEWRR